MTEFTPAGLLEGAKAIVTHNRELRNNVQQLEQSVNQLQIQQFSLVGIIWNTLYVLLRMCYCIEAVVQ